MSEKTLAQLEIGSPEWVAKRRAISGSQTDRRRDAPAPGMLAIGAFAIAASALLLAAARLGSMMTRRR